MEKTIPIIIPSLEPDERLEPLLKALVCASLGPIIMVDDGSGDDYSKYFEMASRDYGATVLTHEVNKGKGRALKDAFKYCLDTYPDMLGCVTADSDGQHTPEDIRKCMDALISNSASLVLGVRDFTAPDVPKKSSFGNNLTHNVCKYLCGVDVSDTQTGLRAIPKKFMAELLEVDGERFEFETYMLLETKGKYDITEVPIKTVYDSAENHQTHFHPVKDSIRIYKIFFARFAKFLFSSLSSCAIDFLLFGLFCHVFKPSMPIYYTALATVLARLISATYNYLVNYKLVFKSKENPGAALFKYAVLAVVQMLLSSTLVTLGVQKIGLSEVLTKLIVDTVLFVCSYIVQREIVFKKSEKK